MAGMIVFDLSRQLPRLPITGARSRDRTDISLRMRDFKSLASTSFAIRASAKAYAMYRGPVRGTPAHPDPCLADGVALQKKAPPKRGFRFGGLKRNRTAVNGFAIRCITTLPRGRTSSADPYCAAIHRITTLPVARQRPRPTTATRASLPGALQHKTPRTGFWVPSFAGRNLEREKGLEPSTPTLARSCSTN